VGSSSFSLSKTQLFVKRFLAPDTPYSGILLFHAVGTGKTCAAITIAEQFVMARPALVIGPPKLQESFRRQIYDPSQPRLGCTGDTYPQALQDLDSRPENRLKLAQDLIASRYQFMGYMELANAMAKMAPNNIREIFSGRVVIIDEVHRTGCKVFSRVFRSLHVRYMLGLSATVKRNAAALALATDFTFAFTAGTGGNPGSLTITLLNQAAAVLAPGDELTVEYTATITGFLLACAAKHGIAVPVNQGLYQAIKEKR
jgi:hypothetical protein